VTSSTTFFSILVLCTNSSICTCYVFLC